MWGEFGFTALRVSMWSATGWEGFAFFGLWRLSFLYEAAIEALFFLPFVLLWTTIVFKSFLRVLLSVVVLMWRGAISKAAVSVRIPRAAGVVLSHVVLDLTKASHSQVVSCSLHGSFVWRRAWAVSLGWMRAFLHRRFSHSWRALMARAVWPLLKGLVGEDFRMSMCGWESSCVCAGLRCLLFVGAGGNSLVRGGILAMT